MINAKLEFSDQELRQILSVELAHHPKLGLTDIYKLFYQAYFGPGHITGDRKQFLEWMKTEIKMMKDQYLPDYQDIGAGKAFVRISLWPLRKLNDQALEAVAELVYDSILEPASEPSLWRELWQKVISLDLLSNDALSEDKAVVDSIIESRGIPHHSEPFSQAYNPHYRLIHISNLPVLHGIIHKGQ